MITITDSEFKQLTEYIQGNYGINLTKKRNLIEGRLSNLIVEKGFDGFSDYLSHVFSDDSKQEITSLVNRLTTNHTYFMRETDHFDYFRDKVLPYLRDASHRNDLRVWSAGCSSGEEPYTLAMILADCFAGAKPAWDTKVLATDISVNALETAAKGIYPAEAVQGLPAAWKMNYFRKTGAEDVQVAEKLKKEVIFRLFNLMDPVFPFKNKFHVIFCRNVMIYFDNKTKMELVNKFYQCTEPGGYLFIGHAETITRNETAYRYIMPAVYRKE